MEKRVKYAIVGVVGIGVLLALSGCVELQANTEPYNITTSIKEIPACKTEWNRTREVTLSGPADDIVVHTLDSKGNELKYHVIYWSNFASHGHLVEDYGEQGEVTFFGKVPTGNLTLLITDWRTGYEIQRKEVNVK